MPRRPFAFHRVALAAFIAAVALALGAPAARAEWIPGGTPICTTPEQQTSLSVVPDGFGGAYFVWADDRGGTPGIYAQRADSNGVVLWPEGGVLVQASSTRFPRDPVAQPFLGGMVIVWQEFAGAGNWDLVAQRIDGAGNRLWAASGVAVSTNAALDEYPALVGNGSAGTVDPIGFYVAWNRADPAGEPDARHVVVKAINSTGGAIWGAGEIVVTTGHPLAGPPVVAQDGTGLAGRARGVVAAWTEYYDGTGNNVYAQRVTAGGVASWSPRVPVCVASGGQSSPAIVQVGTSTIHAWADGRASDGGDIYAQRLISTGVAQWAADGIPVCAAAGVQSSPRMIGDNAGGAIVVWTDARDAVSRPYGQRIDALGQPLWAADGIPLSPTANLGFSPCSATADGVGGAIVAWIDWSAGNADIHAQRVDANGQPLWGAAGVPLCTSAAQQTLAGVVRSGSGVIAAWYDQRSGTSDDLYAVRTTGSPANVSAPVARGAGIGLAIESANPARGPVRLRLALAAPADVTADVLDVSGRRVRTEFVRASLGAGAHALAWDGADDRGRAVPPGVYLVRVRTGERSGQARVVQVR